MIRLWIRVDASHRIGLGHLMRSMAIAESGRLRGLEVNYVVGGDADLVVPLLSRRGLPYRPAGAGTLEWIESVTAEDVVLFDGYHFDPDDYALVGGRGALTVAVDDRGRGRLPVDVVVDPDHDSKDVSYEISPRTSLLTGSTYALVRREFLGRRRPRSSTGRRLVVCLGGTDAFDHASDLLFALREREEFPEVEFVVGPGAHPVSIPAGLPGVTVTTDPPDMATVFDSADAALTASGNTAWEVLTMGLPSAFFALTPEQSHVCRVISASRAGIVVPPAHRDPAGLRAGLAVLARAESSRQLSEAALRLADGRGADRVIDVIVSRRSGSSMVTGTPDGFDR